MAANGEITSGIEPSIATIPAGTAYQYMLVADTGINKTFDEWGDALTALSGKRRVSNETDLTLRALGYWTDNGATYYYRYDESLGYAATLLGIRDDFARIRIPLGYMQLDSWFYGKGPNDAWDARDNGIYLYRASPRLFADGLSGFQQRVGLPIVTHARWLDPSSPYRTQYVVSGNVAIDPKYWDDTMRYLRDSGVVTYEQDWIHDRARALENLTDPSAFFDDMAAAADRYGMTMQYCGPDPEHVLQGTRYDALTTMRVSGDRFEPEKWDEFLYASRFVTAVGAWPWVDVFMSAETKNLLLATLSGGPVGVGDALGTESPSNLLMSVRADGTIVKPDTPFVPTDQTYIAQARSSDAPMIAAASTEDENGATYYVFAYARGSTSSSVIRFVPSQLGTEASGRSQYVYDYFAGTGRAIPAGSLFEDAVAADGSYYVVAPIGLSGMAFLGDLENFASVGKNRVASVRDDGSIDAVIRFAPSEGSRMLTVFSPHEPHVTVRGGSLRSALYDTRDKVERIVVGSQNGESVDVRVAAR